MKRLLPLAALLLAQAASAQIITGGGSGLSGGSGALLIAQSNIPVSVTGTLTETNLAAVKVPANSLTATGLLRITALWTYPNNANNKTLQYRYNQTAGAISGGSFGQTNVSTFAFTQHLFLIRAAGATNSQTAYAGGGANPYGSTATAAVATAVDTTQDSYINLNGVLTNVGDTITLLSYSIEVMHQ